MEKQLATESATGRELRSRTAIVSIIGFWAFYWALVTTRAVIVGFDNQLTMLGPRLLVAATGAFLCYGIYHALWACRRATIWKRVTVAAILALPAAMLFSTANYYAFQLLMHERQAAPSAAPSRSIVIDKGPNGERHIEIRSPSGSENVDEDEAGTSSIAIENRSMSIQVGREKGKDKELAPFQDIAEYAVSAYFFMAAWAALYLALCYSHDATGAERRVAEYRAAAQAAELRALRYQINPHFLFNTLNSLSSLILTGRPEAAEKMLMSLSTFFRTSLTVDPAHDLPLSEEMRMQRLYLDIETTRFPDRLHVAIDVPPELENACVPGLILQPLIENAIKYGVSRARREVTVSIRARAIDHERLSIDVEDDGDPIPVGDAGGTGVGLRNVRERLTARYGDKASVHWGARPGGGFSVTLRMPLVREGC